MNSGIWRHLDAGELSMADIAQLDFAEELAKGVKTEQDVADLSRTLLKMAVETAPGRGDGRASRLRPARGQGPQLGQQPQRPFD